MPEPTLEGVREKVARGEAHFEHLQEACKAYIESDEPPLGISIPYYDPESDRFVCKALVDQPPPLRLGAILGDVVHNLRSALDHLVWQLVIANDKQPRKGSGGNQWPIVMQASSWEKVAKVRLAGLAEAHQETIKTTQPFNLGDQARATHPAILMWLSNTDKHQLVHPALAINHDPGEDAVRFWVESGPGAIKGNPQVWPNQRFEHGADLFRVRVDGHTAETVVKMDGFGLVGVAFGPRGVSMQGIAEVARWVRSVVNTFDEMSA